MRAFSLLALCVGLIGCGGSDRPSAEPPHPHDAAPDRGRANDERDAGDEDAGLHLDDPDADEDAAVAHDGAPASDALPEPSNVRCPAAGSFRVAQIFCGETDVTVMVAGVVTRIGGTFVEGSEHCEVELVASNAECTEASIFTAIYVPDGGRMTVHTNGTEFCDPIQCRFAPTDGPCTLGEGAGSWDESVEIESPDRFRTVRPIGGLCGERPTKLVWEREAEPNGA